MKTKSYNIKNLNDISELVDMPTFGFIDHNSEIATITSFNTQQDLISFPNYQNHQELYINGKPVKSIAKTDQHTYPFTNLNQWTPNNPNFFNTDFNLTDKFTTLTLREISLNSIFQRILLQIPLVGTIHGWVPAIGTPNTHQIKLIKKSYLNLTQFNLSQSIIITKKISPSIDNIKKLINAHNSPITQCDLIIELESFNIQITIYKE